MKAVLLLVAGWLAALAVVAVLVVSGRDTALERGERSSKALAQAMEEHTARTFQGVTLTLGAIADAWDIARPPKNDAEFQELLHRRLRDLPYVQAIAVLAPDGSAVNHTAYERAASLEVGDRPYFKAHVADPALRRAVWPPLISRLGSGWVVPVTARLGHSERLEGVVAAAIDPAYFETLYRKLELGQDEAFALFHRDGTLIARYPAGEGDVGKSFVNLPLFAEHLAQAPSGSYRIDGHMLPGRRIVSYRSVEGLPLVVHVSRSEHAALAEWRRSALGAGVAMGALTLLLGGVLLQQLRARHRRERQRAQRVQAEKLEAMGQLTGGIAHDFANLLNIVSLNMDAILRQPADAQAAQRAALSARRAVERGAELIRRLLAFARRQPLEIKATDLNALLTEAHPLVAQAAGGRIELLLQLAPNLPPVLVDESQFEMALLNLVVNARDAMSGSGRITLRTHRCAEGEPCLTVEDDGPGMREETRRRALEPFFTTKGEAGTGLGLAQVYGFMHQLGGSIDIDSAPGKGTRVVLRFPRAALTGVKAGA